MKNKIKLIFLIIFMILLSSQILMFLKKEHHLKYKINNYSIQETLLVNKKSNYNFLIEDKKSTFSYEIITNTKKKKLIKDIKTFKSNNLICILPIYKKDIKLNVYCNLDNKQVSNYYLLSSNNKEFLNIKQKIKKYKIDYPKTYEQVSKYKNLNIYYKNIDDNSNYIIWNYKGIYLVNKDISLNKKFLDKDIYDNIMATIVDNYYVIFDNTSVNGIKVVYYYDLVKRKLNSLKLKKELSKDSYINGVYKNLIYITDRRNKRQYSLDISSKKLEYVDDEGSKYIFYNDKKEFLSKSDFLIKDQIFTNNTNNYYEYKIKDNSVYKKTKNKNHTILLFTLDNIKDMTVVGDEVIVIGEDNLYSYTESLGLRKIITYNELNYNYKNIYKVWKDS